jgi:hypothetical protein
MARATVLAAPQPPHNNHCLHPNSGIIAGKLLATYYGTELRHWIVHSPDHMQHGHDVHNINTGVHTDWKLPA